MDIRCTNCNKKLLEASGEGKATVTCPRCKTLYVYSFNTENKKQ